MRQNHRNRKRNKTENHRKRKTEETDTNRETDTRGETEMKLNIYAFVCNQNHSIAST